MPYYVRGIVRSKWPSIGPYECKNFQADSIFHELKTDNNALSFWKIENPKEIDKVAAILACSKGHIDTLDLLYIDESLILEENFICDDKEGDTIFKCYKAMHHNIVNLSMGSLERLCLLMLKSIELDQWHRYRTRELKQLVRYELEKENITNSDLPQNILSKINT